MKSRNLLSAVALGLGLTIVLLLLLTHPTPVVRADPGIYYVRAGGSGTTCTLADPCGNIQQAIDLATSPGDEVWVTTGTYVENLVIAHSVKLRGGWDNSFTTQSPDSTPTILDGSGNHNVRVENAPLAEVTVEGLTLCNGKDGIHIDTGNVTVERCTIQNMAKQGIEIDDGTVLISATQILTAQQGIEVDGGVVQVENIHIAHTSKEGLLIEAGGTVSFTGSIIEDCQEQGIQVDQGSVWLFNNYVHDVISDGIRINGGAVSVISNVVSAVAENSGEDYHGIVIKGDQVVIGNLVTDIDDRGIYAREGASTIVGNVVYDTGGDGIRTADTSTNVEIRDNTVYSTGNDGIDARGAAVTITGNRVTGCADNGIKAEEVGSWVYIEANWGLSNSVGIAIHGAPTFTLTNNVVGDNITSNVELAGTGTGFVYHNTLVGSGTGTQGTALAVLSPLNVTLVNNIVVSHTVGITATATATLSVSHTLLWGNSDNPISGTAVLAAPPMFVAPAQQNYHLLPDSPAVDAGIDVGVTSDVDGDPRLGIPDIGADEFALSTFLPLVLRGY